MAKNPGKIFEIIEGNYKGKYCSSYNKEQHKHFTKQNRLVVRMFNDALCVDKLRDTNNGKHLIHIIEIKKLKLIGFID